MKIGKTLYVTKRSEWRKWLSKNHAKEPEVWLIYYKKDSGKPRISYDDAVLEALCYGWIDSTVKSLDSDRFAQRFSPRRKTSGLSQMNLERVRELIKSGRMTKAGLAAIAHVFIPEKDNPDKFIIPEGIQKALKKDSKIWEKYLKLPEDYKRIRIAYIESRKRHSTGMYFAALKNFIRSVEEGKKLGIR